MLLTQNVTASISMLKAKFQEQYSWNLAFNVRSSGVPEPIKQAVTYR